MYETIQQVLATSKPLPGETDGQSGRSADSRIQVLPGRQLDAPTVQAWRHLQDSNPGLASPCFSPEFTQAVAAARTDVEVAVIKQGDDIAAIFPFQRRTSSRAIPVGGIVSDYQGLICSPEFSCDPRELLRACNLVAWDFDRLIPSQSFFAPFYKLCEPSAMIDLSEGYEAYTSRRRARGSKLTSRCENMMRRIQREIGPLRFVSHSADPEALKRVLAWKSDQYLRSGWSDLFALRWGRSLVEQIHGAQSDVFAGMLSLLYAGERLIAGHLGMRSRTVWHYWFPAYDRQYARYSPGLLLLLKMAQHAPALGLHRIDLGTELCLYKRRLMNASIPVAEGSVERPSWLSFQRGARRKLKSLIVRTLWNHR